MTNININRESILWKKFPYSIYLTAEKMGNNSSVSTNALNNKETVDTHSNTYIADIIIEVIHIFFNEEGFFNNDGKKYKYAIPWKTIKLLSPEIKVLLIPLPNIGNIFSIEKFLMFPINIKIMPSNKKGKINRLLLYMELYFNEQQKIVPNINNRII